MLLKFSNHKLGDNIGIFNMGSATDCPSAKLGLCHITNTKIAKCYAKKAEVCYGENVIKHRRAQQAEWQSKSSSELIYDFDKKIKARRKETNYIRFNEAGDFHDQSDITKLSDIAKFFKEEHNITTYGYTARSDLNYESRDFVVRGSGWSHESIDGTTTVITKEEDLPIDGTWILCKGGCGITCNCCTCNFNINIAFLKH